MLAAADPAAAYFCCCHSFLLWVLYLQRGNMPQIQCCARAAVVVNATILAFPVRFTRSCVLACEVDARSNQSRCPSPTFCCEADIISTASSVVFRCSLLSTAASNLLVFRPLTVNRPYPLGICSCRISLALVVDRRRRGCSTCSSRATYSSTLGEIRR